MARSIALLWRRFPLYTGATALIVALQALVVFVWRVPYGIVYSSFVFPPLLTTLVYAFVWADTGSEAPPAGSIWERVLERSWAVIVVDLGVTFVQSSGVAGIQSGDPLAIASGVAVLIVSAPLIFVDTSATVDDMPVWWILPGAFWHGLRTVRSGTAFLRAIAIVALGLLVLLAEGQLLDWMLSAHVANAAFWAEVPLVAVTIPPLAALTALVYRDAKKITAGADAPDDT